MPWEHEVPRPNRGRLTNYYSRMRYLVGGVTVNHLYVSSNLTPRAKLELWVAPEALRR